MALVFSARSVARRSIRLRYAFFHCSDWKWDDFPHTEGMHGPSSCADSRANARVPLGIDEAVPSVVQGQQDVVGERHQQHGAQVRTVWRDHRHTYQLGGFPDYVDEPARTSVVGSHRRRSDSIVIVMGSVCWLPSDSAPVQHKGNEAGSEDARDPA